jgi:hypothetical protein
MPRVTVVDVGDGACAVLRCACVGKACTCPVAVVDCGTWRGSYTRAAVRLREVLHSDGQDRLKTMVVTHFDADHWLGLRTLANSWTGVHLGALDLVYPRLPERAADLPAVTLALFATLEGTGVRALELARTLERTRTVRRRPLCRGDVFRAAGREWYVTWPPRQLPPYTLIRLNRAVTQAEELARRLAEDGEPALRENLDAAYDRSFPGHEPGAESHREQFSAESAASQEELTRLGAIADDWSSEDSAAEYLHGSDRSLLRIPVRYREEFRRVSRRVAAANNDLSLIFHDGGHLAVFGDAGPSVLTAALAGMPERYCVVLAPHHGSRHVPPGFPEAEVCVAQAGVQHERRWMRHVHSHGQPRSCVNTAHIGTISVW